MDLPIGHRVRSIRQRIGMAQSELARRAGISSQALNALERRGIDPRASVVIALARALHVSSDVLLGLAQELAPDELLPQGEEVDQDGLALLPTPHTSGNAQSYAQYTTTPAPDAPFCAPGPRHE